MVLAALVGSTVGIAAYSIAQTGGQTLSIVVGGLAGVALALGAQFYRQSGRLTEVKVTLPVGEMTFAPTTDTRQAAERLFFQAATRVATRPLSDEGGNLRAALASLRKLVDLYREPVESGTAPPPPPAGDSVNALVLTIINHNLAPFLEAWHPWLDAWSAEQGENADERAWPGNAAFRADLKELQDRLRPYVIGLGNLAGIRNPEQYLRPPDWRPGAGRPPLPHQQESEPDVR
ncbi:hypothetical protein DNK56_01535 [Streptomyces sp. AC1-42W]|nr:hypothetical protein DNK55_30035 [Streptomyces sp. AC1-42T]PZT80953.1 hypothetical protein DNK56_01535 [Streptomyces sp. AC1-42W]